MITTDLIKDTQPWDQDAKVHSLVVELQARIKCHRAKGKLLRHAILNAEGRPYRVIETRGLIPLLTLVDHLPALGLTDLLRDVFETRQGFDAIWSPCPLKAYPHV